LMARVVRVVLMILVVLVCLVVLVGLMVLVGLVSLVCLMRLVRLLLQRLNRLDRLRDWLLDMLLNQAANCMPGEPARAASVAIAAVQSVGPRDGIEAMLAVQMAATHAAAMQMLHRAVREQPSFEIYDSLVNRATKLLRTYTMQVEALKRYRSASEQRVVVQHVNVTAEQAAVQVNGGGYPAPGGRGAASETEDRSHGPGEPQAVAPEPGAPLPCPDPARNVVPVTGGERAGPLSVSRRR